MLIDETHVSLNGVHYLLRESPQGDHYIHHFEPLMIPFWISRPVGGRPGKDSVRRDVMYWDSDDWSGGEGEKFFSSGRSVVDADPTVYYLSTDANSRNPGFLAVRPTRSVVTVM